MDALYYTLWSIVCVLIAVPALGFAALVIALVRDERRLRRRLAAASCPHCRRPIGPAAATAALHTPVPDAGGNKDPHTLGGIDDGARLLLCPACGRESFFYRFTEVITPTYTPLAGIPESTRPLPPNLK